MNKKKNIMFIPGILTTEKMLSGWEKYLKKNFNDKNIHIIRGFYLYNQKNRLDEITENILKILRKDEDTIIISHSFGGILAIVSYLKNIKEGRNNIKKIITMGAPHSKKMRPLSKIKIYLGYNNVGLEKGIIKTFGGFFDFVVPNRYSKIKNIPHQSFFCIHNYFLFNNKIIKTIVKEIDFDQTS